MEQPNFINALRVEIASFCQNNKVFAFSHGNVLCFVVGGKITSGAFHYLVSEVISLIIYTTITGIVTAIDRDDFGCLLL